MILRNEYSPLVLLPSCSYPSGYIADHRQKELWDNIEYIHYQIPYSRILVVDTGEKAPVLPSYAKLIYLPHSYSNNHSVGEIQMLLEGLKDLHNDQLVLKLHARCKLLNFKKIKKLIITNQEFMLLNKNIFSSKNFGIDRLPYIDTRVFCVRASSLRILLNIALDYSLAGVKYFEHSIMASFYKMPDFAYIVITNGSFYPILLGSSGHGRNYSSLYSLTRSYLKSILFRFGL